MKYIILLLLPFCLQAQTVTEILNAHFDSTGGKKQWTELKTIVLEADLNLNNSLFKLKSFSKAPSKSRNEVAINGQKSVSVFDGRYGWKKDFSQLAQYMNDEEYFKAKADSDFYSPLLNYSQNGFKIKRKSDKSINKVKCYVINISKKEESYTYFITKDKHRILAETILLKKKKTRLKYSDYRMVKGLWFPFKIEEKDSDGVLIGIKINTIKINQLISDQLFEFDN